MSYDRESLICAVIAALQARPRVSLGELSAALGVHRHTLDHALRGGNLNFVSLRAEAVGRAADVLRRSNPGLSKKQVAYALGFPSPSAFAHYVSYHRERRGGRAAAVLKEMDGASRERTR
ncbi:MAG TPA: hypothetical protein VE996_01110 [Terriglobales bacterium]|nr:hypothetical protein [Terriglobales bacterium]